MDTSKKILIGAIGATVTAGGIAIGLLLSKTPEKTDLSTIHTKAATEAPKGTLPAAIQTPEAEEATEGQEDAASSVSTSIETYTSGKVPIQYPAVDQMGDASKKDKTNGLLKTNALSFIKTNDIDGANDTLDIKCKVVSVDHKRLTATYTGTLLAKGAAHPVNLFYSNTVNLFQTQNLGLDDFTDAYTMVRYVLSGDVKFSDISSDVEARVLSYHSSVDLGSLTTVFGSADLPLSSEIRWLESFSYGKQGTICFSLPVPHALSDYVLVAFDPTIKWSFSRGWYHKIFDIQLSVVLVDKGAAKSMDNVMVSDHPLIQHKTSILRNKAVGTDGFRTLIGEIAMLMGYEALRDLPLEGVEVGTPIETRMTPTIAGRKLAVVPILRAGPSIVNGILALVPSAKVGHIGLCRDEVTHEPHEYYCKLPNPIRECTIIVTGPVLATGGSGISAIDFIKEHDGKKIKFMAIIAAPEGLKRPYEAHPNVQICVGHLDRYLDENTYVCPRLGDIGDRIFGTK